MCAADVGRKGRGKKRVRDEKRKGQWERSKWSSKRRGNINEEGKSV